MDILSLRLETNRLYLVSTSKEKLQGLIDFNKSAYLSWFGDLKVNQYNSHGLFPQSQSELNNFFQRCDNDKSLLSFMIIEKKSAKHIGMISLQRIDWINRSAEFAVVIGETDCWGQGFTTEACQVLFHHGFMRLGLNRIWSGTSILNKGMIRVFNKLNMKHEGTFKQGQFLNGKFEDVVAYAILKNKYIKKNN
jgi:RimJ/RimL family protein N-acetyltransferase